MTVQSQGLSLRMLVVSSGILASRLLGLLRDIVFAYIFGTGTAFAAFVIANTFPNLLRSLFGEGAFAHAMVPVFSARLQQDGQSKAWLGACRVISSLLVVVTGLVAAGMVAVVAIRPWFAGELPQLTLGLIPWLLPYAVMVCVCAALAAVLNSIGHFTVPAYSQTIMNMVLIMAAIIPTAVFPLDGETVRIRFLVGGVLGAGLVQLYLHLRASRRSLAPFEFIIAFRDPMVVKVARLMAPALLGAGVMQVNIVVDRILAGWLGDLATTSLYYSQRLIYLPVGLFGVAMGIVALPMMSQAWARHERQQMMLSLQSAYRQVLFLTLPTVALLAALRYPVLELLFERGDFTAQSTAGTAWAMLFYLPGIPAFACAKIAVTPFYGSQDTRTPVRVAVLCLVCNVVLNLILMQFLAQGGLALATTICSTLNVVILLALTRRQLGVAGLGRLVRPTIKMLIAGVAVYVAAVITFKLMPVGGGIGAAWWRVAGPSAAAVIVYLTAARVLGCEELQVFLTALAGHRRFR